MDLAELTRFVSAVRPLSDASSVFCAWPIESRRELRSLARLLRDWDVKKFDGLSRAELTFLPVARRPCVVAASAAVFCKASKFCRTLAESTMPFEAMVVETFLVGCRTGD